MWVLTPNSGGSSEIHGHGILRDTADKRAVCILLKCFTFEIYLRNVREPLLDKVGCAASSWSQKDVSEISWVPLCKTIMFLHQIPATPTKASNGTIKKKPLAMAILMDF